MALLLLPLSLAAADGGRVLVVADGDNALHQKVIAAFRQQLNAAEVLEVTQEALSRTALQDIELVVSLGALTRRDLSAIPSGVPLLYSLITESEWRNIADEDKAVHRQTALYIEQPPERMVRLVKSALPDRTRLTVALGPTSISKQLDVGRECQRQMLDCVVMRVTAKGDIERALDKAASRDKVLLVLPDAQVVNSSTAHNLILGAYRRGVALVGYSRALVKAGALMAVHSTPVQLGEDTAVMARTILHQQRTSLPPGRYPSRYSVSVNYQLARALDLELESEGALQQVLNKAESDE